MGGPIARINQKCVNCIVLFAKVILITKTV